jgi:hypothetical protein
MVVKKYPHFGHMRQNCSKRKRRVFTTLRCVIVKTKKVSLISEFNNMTKNRLLFVTSLRKCNIPLLRMYQSLMGATVHASK